MTILYFCNSGVSETNCNYSFKFALQREKKIKTRLAHKKSKKLAHGLVLEDYKYKVTKYWQKKIYMYFIYTILLMQNGY